MTVYTLNINETLSKVETVADLIDQTKSYCYLPLYEKHCIYTYPAKLNNISEVLLRKQEENIKIELKIDLKHLIAVIDPKKVSEKQLNIIREYRRKQVVKEFFKEYSVSGKIIMPPGQLIMCRCPKKVFVLYKGRTLELIESNELIPVFTNINYPILEVKTGNLKLKDGRFSYVKYDNFSRDLTFKDAAA